MQSLKNEVEGYKTVFVCFVFFSKKSVLFFPQINQRLWFNIPIPNTVYHCARTRHLHNTLRRADEAEVIQRAITV